MTSRVFSHAVLAAVVVAGAAGAGRAQTPPAVTASAGPTGLSWQPQLPYERAYLRIGGPQGLVAERAFGPGEALAYDLTDRQGRFLSDGAYTWEIRLVPPPDPNLRARWEAARRAGDEATAAALEADWRARHPAARHRASGTFSMRGGVVVGEGDGSDDPGGPRDPYDVVVPDDQIVQGDQCVGAVSCVDGLSFSNNVGNPDLFIKSVDPQVFFENNGDADFAIEVDANNFAIWNEDAPEELFTLTSTGNLGLGTNAPAGTLDIVRGSGDADPELRLSGFNTFWADNGAVQLIYDPDGISSTEGAFKMRIRESFDAAFVNVPLVISEEAPDDSLVIDGAANLGLGTSTPTERLHVRGISGTTKLLVEEASATTGARELFKLSNNGGPFFIFTDTSLAQSYSFAMGATGDFLISHQQTPGTELRLTKTGNLTISGSLTQGSSRQVKDDIAPVDGRAILERVSALPIATWRYRADPRRARHLGPMAEDFHRLFGLGETDQGIGVLDAGGVALAAIQGLNQAVAGELRQKDEEIERLRAAVASLAGRLAALEARGPASEVAAGR